MADAASGGLVESVVQLLTEFGKVAFGVDPLTTVLLLLGGLLTGASVLFFTYLTVGAVLDSLGDLIPSPSGPGGRPPERE
ncbi:MAG: hypothetical protein V5A85_06980 [Haloarculaceae archaeon]|jgi:hypothetical protein